MKTFRELSTETLKNFSDLENISGDSGLYTIRGLIENIRSSLASNTKQTGMWEAVELNYADEALTAGYPKVALIAAGKALAISQLSSEEYKFGFELLRQQTAILLERNALRDNAKTSRKSAAEELSANHEQTALNLRSEQEATADHLKSAQNDAASLLIHQQEDAASALIEKNMVTAFELSEKEAAPTMEIAKNEATKILQQQITRECTSWAPDSYSISSPANASPGDLYNTLIHQREAAAQQLSDQQSQAASDLNKNQSETATDLKRTQKLDAEELKNAQKISAITLKENQTIRALRKTIIDGDNTNKK